MNKILRLAFIFGILVFLAVAILLKNFVGKETVIVSSENLTAGTIIKEEMLSTADIPMLARIENVALTKAELVGKTLLIERRKKDQISTDMTGDKKIEIAPDEGQIMIPISKEEGERIRQGTIIDVITWQINGAGGESHPDFKVIESTLSRSSTSGREEYSLFVIGKSSLINKISPYIKTGNFKIQIKGE